MFAVRERIAGIRRGLSLGQQIEAHPWRILGTAMAIGVVLGRIRRATPPERAPHGLAASVLDDAAQHLVRSVMSTVSAAVAAAIGRELARSLHRRSEAAAAGRPRKGVTIYPPS